MFINRYWFYRFQNSGCGADGCGDSSNGSNKDYSSGCSKTENVPLGGLLCFYRSGFARLSRLDLDGGLGFYLSDSGLLGNQSIQRNEVITDSRQIQLGGKSSDIAVKTLNDFCQLSILFCGIGTVALFRACIGFCGVPDKVW